MTKHAIPALVATLMMGSACLADNPIVQTRYTADPAPMVHNDTLYVFTSHDEDVTVRNFFTMNDWRCYSTTDMVNWTDHGMPLGYKDFAWARGDAWAPHVIERDGKFFFYVPVNRRNGGNVIGVAVADKIQGPYKDALGRPLISAGGGNIDPVAFIDVDGQAYLYWGNPALKYVKLNRDMISYDQTVGIVTVPLTAESFGRRTGNAERATLYEEGPWLYKHNKRNDIYYMIFAASGIPENICYSTGPSATGPWTFRGVIMPTENTRITGNRASSFTNHPGVVDFKGRSYFFYHNGALPGGGGYKRSVCVEEFKFNDDGTFPTIQMTKAGPAAIANLDPYRRQQAATICWTQGVRTLARGADKPGVYVTVTGSDAYIKVASVDFGTAGPARFLASVAATAEGTAIELRVGSLTSDVVGTLKVTPTGALDKWESQTTTVTGVKGVHDLYLKFTGSGSPLMNIDTWIFEQ